MADFSSLSDHSVLRIPAGIHHITSPIRISGKHDIHIIGENGAILRGTIHFNRADFIEESPGVFSAPVAMPVDVLWVGGRRYTMARYPKATSPDVPFGGYSADCILPGKTKDWTNPAGGYIHALHRHLWGGFSYRIEGKNPDGTLRLSGGWQNNRQMGMHDEYRFAENIREEMTEAGEWFFDENALRIYVRLVPGDDLEQAEASVTDGFFILENCENIVFENLTIERSSRSFMKTKEPLLRSDWTIYRSGAVTFRNSERCAIKDCTFRDIGSNGVFVDGNCSEIAVTRSHFVGIGASGLCFVGQPDAVFSPLFEYGETQTIDKIDLTPGPKSENYPKNCIVEDCLIQEVGLIEKQATGVEISMSYGITVKNCTICRTSRAGINISEGTFGGHRIEGCDIFDTVRETGDHGSFNSWGRDRFWNLGGVDKENVGQYAVLDMLDANTIVRNRFRCDRGWDIDLDDGSTNYIIEENLCLNGGIKLREGFFRTVRHNVCVNNTLHFHVWYPNSGDVAEENIVFSPYAPIMMPEHWGSSVNRNILYDPDAADPVHADALSSLSGQDGESLKRSLIFRMPDEGDFRPLDLPGFENFPTEFGVRYQPLRQIAPLPTLPQIRTVIPRVEKNDQTVIHLPLPGLTVKNIETDGEMSVYGTAERFGALVMAVEDGSFSDSIGLRKGDVIVEWGGLKIPTANVLNNCADVSTCIPIRVLRNQKEILL